MTPSKLISQYYKHRRYLQMNYAPGEDHFSYHLLFKGFKHNLDRYRSPMFKSKKDRLMYVANMVIDANNVSTLIGNAKYYFNKYQNGVEANKGSYGKAYWDASSMAAYLFEPYDALYDMFAPLNTIFKALEQPIQECHLSRRYQDATTFYSWCARYIVDQLKSYHIMDGGNVLNDIYNLAYYPSSAHCYPIWKGYKALLPKINK